MKKILQSILVAVMGMVVVGSASAQTFNINDLQTSGPPGTVGTGYNVVITQTGNSFVVNSIKALGGAGAPTGSTSGISQVSLTFFSTFGGSSNAAGVADAVNTFGTTAGTAPGGPFSTSNSTASATFANDVPVISNPTFNIQPNGSNTFSTTAFTVTGPIRSFNVNLQGDRQYSANVDELVVPESASSGLLLAALLPMAFVVWRRRSANSAV